MAAETDWIPSPGKGTVFCFIGCFLSGNPACSATHSNHASPIQLRRPPGKHRGLLCDIHRPDDLAGPAGGDVSPPTRWLEHDPNCACLSVSGDYLCRVFQLPW